MRPIDTIIVHCSATPPSMSDVGAEEIDRWHKERGWDGIGYHVVIRRDGKREDGRPLEKPGAHARGHNANSIGVCLIGGVDEDGKPDANFTNVQYQMLYAELIRLTNLFPGAKVIGHRDVSDKACPSFDVQAFWGR